MVACKGSEGLKSLYRPFHNFRASKFRDCNTLLSAKTSIDRFCGSRFVKGTAWLCTKAMLKRELWFPGNAAPILPLELETLSQE